ncbi:chain length determinant protein [Rufibacter psychrotolerans]|uniref:chain length determinant protein n=1 Tax=Rufibacter psychrotolerans TaxID=2812556 RepID=UPI0019688B0E|nr:chain length determinant protein [Rufibacter sp. SYSU D00308]
MRETDKMSRKVSEDEIDLDVLFGRMNRFFSRLYGGIKSVFRFLRRKALTLLLFTLVGLAAAFGLHTVSRPYYSSDMTMVLPEVRNEYVEDLVSNLNLMVKEKNSKQVSKHLGISEQTALDLKGVTYQTLDQGIPQDSVLEGGPFIVTVEVYNNQVFDSLQTGIARYLGNNHYFNKQRQIKQEHLGRLVDKLKEDIASLDSVKRKAIELNGPANGLVYGEALDPSQLYRESLSFYEKQTGIEAEIKRLNNIEVVVGFIPRLAPSGPSLVKYLLVGALSAFLLGCLVALYADKRRVA